jgi:VWFA-related protein
LVPRSSRCLALIVFAMSAQQPAIRVTTRLVEISVVVHDKNGAVEGLTKDDFILLDKGKPQTIALFNVISVRKDAPRPLALPANIVSNRPEYLGATSTATVVLFDSLNTSFGDQYHARRQILKFLRQLEPQDRIALYVLSNGIRVLQDFTSDSQRLTNAIQKLRGTQASELAASEVEASNTGDAEIDQFLDEAAGIIADFNTVNRITRTVEAIQAIANHLARIPGRKNLVWVSGAFPLTLGLDGPSFAGPSRESRTFVEEMQRAARALNEANVAVYPVDVRGLIAPQAMSAASPARINTKGPPQVVSLIPKNLDTMEDIASRTGGRAFYNTNDLRGAIRTAMNDAEITYTLGFYPPSESLDGRFHDVKVQVKRRGLNVRHRRGYLASDPSALSEKQREAEMRNALMSPLNATGIGLSARVDPSEVPKPGSLQVMVALDLGNLTTERKDDRWVGSADVVFVQVGKDGKNLGTSSERLEMKLTDERYQDARKNGLVLIKRVIPAAGLEEIRVVVLDRSSGHVGSLVLPADKIQQNGKGRP